jgi:hypothetical protein
LCLKPFLYHSVLLNYSSLSSLCLLNVTEKLVFELSISHKLRQIQYSIYSVLLWLSEKRWDHQEMILPMHYKFSCSIIWVTKTYQYDLGNSTLVRFRKLAAFTL